MSDTRDPYVKQRPGKVKPQESSRINLAYTNITENFRNGIPFHPVEGVPYLWVYTEHKEVIVGIEEPWKYPQAFVDVTDKAQLRRFNERIKPQLIMSGMLGHPTLASAFSEKGVALPEHGRALIGGELKFDPPKWKLDNYSGRFGLLRNKPEEVQLLMHQVTKQFDDAMNLKPDFSITLPHASHLPAYYALWKKGKNDVDSALQLLADYTKKNAAHRVFMGHWNRHNVDLVDKALTHFRSKSDLTIKDILSYFSTRLDGEKTNPDGSLMRRLQFIAGQTNTEFKLSEAEEVRRPTMTIS